MPEIRKIILFKEEKSGKEPFTEWLKTIKDIRAKAKISVYLERMLSGNFGHAKSLGQGLFELKINFGAGYRVYYILEGLTLVILLIGGDKNSQAHDIKKARGYLEQIKRRNKNG